MFSVVLCIWKATNLERSFSDIILNRWLLNFDFNSSVVASLFISSVYIILVLHKAKYLNIALYYKLIFAQSLRGECACGAGTTWTILLFQYCDCFTCSFGSTIVVTSCCRAPIALEAWWRATAPIYLFFGLKTRGVKSCFGYYAVWKHKPNGKTTYALPWCIL